ncbi:MAG: hypothetical protein OXN84_06745 [Albidovulum sp.]|nr:hypothetical protein [Albidovulum sp.]MDE0530894.1 hypothetical protein [Albidovulum sp.]
MVNHVSTDATRLAASSLTEQLYDHQQTLAIGQSIGCEAVTTIPNSR